MIGKIKFFTFLISGTLLYSCVSEFSPKLPDNLERILVVEGDILSDTTVQFWFSYSLPLVTTDKNIEPVEVELYIISDDNYRSEKADYIGEGCHQIKVPELDRNKGYAIEFIHLGNTYKSSFIKPVVTPAIDSISFYQAKEYDDVQIRISTHTEGSEASYFLWDFHEDWEFSAQYDVSVFYDPGIKDFVQYPGAVRFYCWNEYANHDILVSSTEKLLENRIINQALYRREADSRRFSLLYSTRVKQRALSKAAYEYYLDLQKNNGEMGGLFTPQPSSIEGNITCVTNAALKTIGFVDVCDKVEEYQLYINSNEISRNRYVNCGILTHQEASAMMNQADITMHQFIAGGYHPILYSTSYFEPIWVYTTCLDCILDGGTKNKPDFWPNDHE